MPFIYVATVKNNTVREKIKKSKIKEANTEHCFIKIALSAREKWLIGYGSEGDSEKENRAALTVNNSAILICIVNQIELIPSKWKFTRCGGLT